jgi:hypothetical protein
MAAGLFIRPEKTSVRPFVPSFMITAPTAPASVACSTLVWNGHVPRRIRATAPRSKPAKSAASQPLVELAGGPAPSWRFTGRSRPVTSPEPELVKVRTAPARSSGNV